MNVGAQSFSGPDRVPRIDQDKLAAFLAGPQRVGSMRPILQAGDPRSSSISEDFGRNPAMAFPRPAPVALQRSAAATRNALASCTESEKVLDGARHLTP